MGTDNIILKNTGHRMLLDDNGTPVKMPHLSRKKRKAETKGLRHFMEYYNTRLYQEYHLALKLHQDVHQEQAL